MTTWLLYNGKHAVVRSVDYPPITLRGSIEGYPDEVRWANDGRLLGFFSAIHGQQIPIPFGTLPHEWDLIRLADGGPKATGR